MKGILLGQVKRSRTSIVKVLDEVSLFDEFKFSSVTGVEYSSGHHLDDDCWFCVQNFSESENFPSYFGDNFSTADVNVVKKSEFDNLKWIWLKSEKYYYFQVLSKASFLKKRKIIIQNSDQISMLDNDNSKFIINESPDVVYDTDSDSLYFRDIGKITRIISSLSSLHKEATDDDVDSFMNLSFVNFSSKFKMSEVSKTNRDRIVQILDRSKALTDEEINGYFDYAKKYNSKINISEDGTSFLVSGNEELRILCYVLSERYYEAVFIKEKRLANSVSVVR